MILVDTGPLVALIDRNDRHHEICLGAAGGLPATLQTVWPSLTEAAHLLSEIHGGPFRLLDLLGSGRLQLLDLDIDDVPRIRELMRKYSDLPMDLTDAALVRVSEREKIDTIFTLDRRHFSLYRPAHRRRLEIVP